jgi:O-antigen ligase
LTIQILGFWAIAGILFSPSLYILVPLSVLYFSNQNKYQLLFFGFWFILILSDSRNAWSSAANVKIIYILLLLYFFLVSLKRFRFKSTFVVPFVPFILASIISIAFSVDFFVSVQKTLSYILILIVVPVYTKQLLHENKYLFLYNLVWFGAFILLSGLALKIAAPGFVTLAERFTGILGNPNGLGIFLILYTMLWLIIKYYYPQLFSIKDRRIITLLIFLSLILCASRGAMFSIAMFYAMEKSITAKNPLIMVAVLISGVGFFFVDNIVDLLYKWGIGEYFRAQTLEKAGGRTVAFEFAWKEIKLSPIFGRGFGYTEYIFHREDIKKMLNDLNHQGNTHNSYMTIIMDTGFVGFVTFLLGWLYNFGIAIKKSAFAFPVLVIALISTNIESWLAASLNPFTIVLIIILTLLTEYKFLNSNKT